MHRKIGNSNTHGVAKLLRTMSYGQHLANIGGAVKVTKNVGKTFYLTYDNEIISFRKWKEKGSPDYVVSGSFEGCEGTMKRRMERKSTV